MNIRLIFEIAQLVFSLLLSHASGTLQQDATLANTLLQIVQKGAQDYSEQTGKPLDPGLIKPEVPV